MTALPIADHAPMKPKYGDQCNGCGYCCAAEVCAVGKAIHGDDTPAPCPSMTYQDRKFSCGALPIADSIGGEYGLALRLMLGIGIGCDALMTGEAK